MFLAIKMSLDRGTRANDISVPEEAVLNGTITDIQKITSVVVVLGSFVKRVENTVYLTSFAANNRVCIRAQTVKKIAIEVGLSITDHEVIIIRKIEETIK